MQTLGSVFIMDVSQSSAMLHPTHLTEHLRNTVAWLTDVADMHPQALAFKHRFGDEVLLVARGLETAYLVAFYVAVTWPYLDHSPYFGASYGDLRSDVPTNDDLDTWNSPAVKWARRAADTLKQEKVANRQWLLFDDGGKGARAAHANHPGATASDTRVAALAQMLNEYTLVQDRFFKLQTEPEHVAGALYTLHGRQDEVARTLKKHPSTISRQIRKSNIDVILTLKDRIVDLLHAQPPQATAGRARASSAPASEHRALASPNHTMLELHIRQALRARADLFLHRGAASDRD